MFTCHLTKLETALEQTRKAYPKLKPTDAALVASALSLAGRHAVAVYEGEHYSWPEDYSALTKVLVPHLSIVQEGIDNATTKKPAKGAEEGEPIMISVGLAPNITVGEKQLDGFPKLKTLLSEILQEGVEFVYAPSDIGWQWALDRANWATIGDQEFSRRIKVKTAFTEGAVGTETGTAKKRASRSKPPQLQVEVEPEVESVPELDAAND